MMKRLTEIDRLPGRTPDVAGTSTTDVGEPLAMGDRIATTNGRFEFFETGMRRNSIFSVVDVAGAAAAS